MFSDPACIMILWSLSLIGVFFVLASQDLKCLILWTENSIMTCFLFNLQCIFFFITLLVIIVLHPDECYGTSWSLTVTLVQWQKHSVLFTEISFKQMKWRYSSLDQTASVQFLPKCLRLRLPTSLISKIARFALRDA